MLKGENYRGFASLFCLFPGDVVALLQSRRFDSAICVELSSLLPVLFSVQKGEIMSDVLRFSAHVLGTSWRSDSDLHASIEKIYLGHLRYRIFCFAGAVQC